MIGDLQFTSLPASGGNDTLSGDAGNDTIFGQGGNDTLYGGDGNDLLEGMNNDDLMYGGAGNDTIWGGTGGDTINGGKWLPDQDMAWRLCEQAVVRVRELENEIGCFFDRNLDGTLHHKAFAGQTARQSSGLSPVLF